MPLLRSFNVFDFTLSSRHIANTRHMRKSLEAKDFLRSSYSTAHFAILYVHCFTGCADATFAFT